MLNILNKTNNNCMVIRKRFNVESSHVVRNCTSERCSHSHHGHSAMIDVFFEGHKLDNAQMLMDFGLMKGTIKEFIDSMDHCALICTKDAPEYVEFFKKFNDRYILIPFNPSAEMLSIFIMHYVNKILSLTKFNNGEGDITCVNVEYNETATGMARCDVVDDESYWNKDWDNQIIFSEGVIRDWSQDLEDVIIYGMDVKNPIIEQQIKLD